MKAQFFHWVKADILYASSLRRQSLSKTTNYSKLINNKWIVWRTNLANYKNWWTKNWNLTLWWIPKNCRNVMQMLRVKWDNTWMLCVNNTRINCWQLRKWKITSNKKLHNRTETAIISKNCKPLRGEAGSNEKFCWCRMKQRAFGRQNKRCWKELKP